MLVNSFTLQAHAVFPSAMRPYLLRLLLLVFLQAYFLTSYGQTSLSNTPPITIVPDPLYLVNSTIVVNGALGHIIPNDMDKMMIYRSGTAPELLNSLTSTGIIDMMLKKSSKAIKSKSFKQVARQQKVRGPFRVALNGQLLSAAQATTLRIAPAAIGQVQVTPATVADPAALLSITLAKYKPVPKQHPPGTIMIRGMAVQ